VRFLVRHRAEPVYAIHDFQEQLNVAGAGKGGDTGERQDELDARVDHFLPVERLVPRGVRALPASSINRSKITSSSCH